MATQTATSEENSKARTPSLAHLNDDALLAELNDRVIGLRLTMETVVVCAYWDDFELSDEQFEMLMKRFDNFRPGYEARA